MKKIISFAIVCVMLFSLTACSITETAGTDRVDVDLTALSSTMIYAEVNNMVTNPSEYTGKIVKMRGQFVVYQAQDENGNPVDGSMYFACIIPDATGCCSQGLEFVLSGEHVYPDDYPEIGADICVMGSFDTYQEGAYTYCTLRNASFV